MTQAIQYRQVGTITATFDPVPEPDHPDDRIPDGLEAWAAPRHGPQFMLTEVVSCSVCGALVSDTALHDDWHARAALRQETP